MTVTQAQLDAANAHIKQLQTVAQLYHDQKAILSAKVTAQATTIADLQKLNATLTTQLAAANSTITTLTNKVESWDTPKTW